MLIMMHCRYNVIAIYSTPYKKTSCTYLISLIIVEANCWAIHKANITLMYSMLQSS